MKVRVNQLVVPVAAAALLLVSSTVFAAPTSCDEAKVLEVKAAIDAACPCDGLENGTVPWKNHGQYVKCVTRARKVEAKNAELGLQCLKGVVPCAANSTCGHKAGAVACHVTTGTCLGGTCDNEQEECNVDSDCAQSSCFIADSVEECDALQGTATTGSCCQ